jgi:hypothetical protein
MGGGAAGHVLRIIPGGGSVIRGAAGPEIGPGIGPGFWAGIRELAEAAFRKRGVLRSFSGGSGFFRRRRGPKSENGKFLSSDWEILLNSEQNLLMYCYFGDVG